MAVSTTSTEPELISEYWNNVFLNELRENLVFYDYGLKSMPPSGTGVMTHWLSLADTTGASVTGVTEGTDPTETTLSAGDQTATLAQYGEAVLISDILQETWVAGSYQQLMERLARSAALTIDTVIRNICFTAGGSAQFAGTASAIAGIDTTTTFAMNVAEIREAVNSLESNACPTYPDGFYVGIIHPDVKYDLQGDTAQWQEILQHTDRGYAMMQDKASGMRPGPGGKEVGTMFGVKFIMSQLALMSANAGSATGTEADSADLYQSYIFGPEQFGVSMLQGVQTIVKNPHPASDLDLYGTVGYKVAFAARELESKRMTNVWSGSSLG